jgi:hypothetical protein
MMSIDQLIEDFKEQIRQRDYKIKELIADNKYLINELSIMRKEYMNRSD